MKREHRRLKFVQENQLDLWEQEIRSGRGSEIAASIRKVNPSRTPLKLMPRVANLARRAGEYKFALTFLKKAFLEAREKPFANEALVAEYAANLTEVGATSVAERLLAQFENPTYEMTPFYRALLWMKKWEYERVPDEIATFKKICSDPYKLKVADVNLVSALILLKRNSEAAKLLKALDQNVDLPPMLRGIVDEQKGELLFSSGKRKEARLHFEGSLKNISQSNNPSALYAEKWLNIIDLYDFPWEEIEDRWSNFSKKIQARGFWEIHRELEKHFAIRFDRKELLTKLYFGTPLIAYRRLLLSQSKLVPPEYFQYPSDLDANVVLYFPKLEIVKQGKKLKVPVSIAKALFALTRDLYRPAAVGSLFETLYPRDYYHPQFATKRVHQIIARVREFERKHKLGFGIQSSKFGFELVVKKGFRIVYSNQEPSDVEQLARVATAAAAAKKLFGNAKFSASEFAEKSGMSKRSANRVIADEVESGSLIASGKGKSLRYHVGK